MKGKLKTISNLFEGNEIRSIWDSEKEDYYFSVIDVISVLTDNNYQKSRNYWKWLKNKLILEGSELVSITNQFKMKASDGKLRKTDTLDTKGILRLIESVPSPKAEPFKMWLADLGKERIDEVFDPAKGIDKMIDYYLKKGYTLDWIKQRVLSIVNRKELTNTWENSGITKQYEFGILTNEIYKKWSGMTAGEYKNFKGIRKESLRDNMTEIEVILTDLGETATKILAKKHKPKGLKQNKYIASLGGTAARAARDNLENNLKETIISKENNLNYKYIQAKEKSK